MECRECGEKVEGEARVDRGALRHPKCSRKFLAREAGFPYECPVCHGEPRKEFPAHMHDHTKDEGFGYGGEGGPGDSRSFQEFVPARVEVCEQCHGRGYVAKEPRLVVVAKKWVTE